MRWVDLVQPVPTLAAVSLLLLCVLACGVAHLKMYPFAYLILFLVVLGAFQVGRITAEH